MGGSKKKVKYEPAPAPAVAVQRQGTKSFKQEADMADIETDSDLYIKKKRKGKKSLKVPAGGALVPTEGASGLSLPS